MNAKAQLEQQICSKFGWSAQYFRIDETGAWAVDVRTGVGAQQCHRCVSTDTSPPTKKGTKQGCNAAAALAVQRLAPLVEAQLRKPQASIGDVFASELDGVRVLESSADAWREMAAALCECAQPTVGIDVEGNQCKGSAPVLVQLACRGADGRGLVILEAPDRNVGLSAPLKQLLSDTQVVKVFIDGPANSDMTALGLAPNAAEKDGALGGHVIDLELVANALAGAPAVRRGVARLVEMALPHLGYRIVKDSSFGPVAIFAAIDQGKHPPLRSLSELPLEAQRYATLDAWCTLRAWEGWQEQFQVHGGEERISETFAAGFGLGIVADGRDAAGGRDDTPGTTAAGGLSVELDGSSVGAIGAGSSIDGLTDSGAPGAKDPVMAFMERCQRTRGTPAFSFQNEGVEFRCSVTVIGGEEVMSGVTVTGAGERTKKQAKKAAAIAWMAVAGSKSS